MSKQIELSEEEIVAVVTEALDILNAAAEGNETMKRHIAAGVVTPIMLAKTVGVPGPMIYTYVGKGFIEGRRDALTNRVLIDVAEAARFIAKRIAKVNKVKAEVAKELQTA